MIGALLCAAVLAGVSACTPSFGDEPATVRAPTSTPTPTPTWTPIPFATPTLTAQPAATSPPPSTPTAAATLAPPVAESPAAVPQDTPTAAPTPAGPTPYSADDLRRALPTVESLQPDAGTVVSAPGDDGYDVPALGLSDQFLDPIVVRRGEPFLLALVFVGQAVTEVDALVVNEIVADLNGFLGTLAGGLVAGLQDSAREAELLELETVSAPLIGSRSAAARALVSSGADQFEASVRIAERAGIVGLLIQIARVADVQELLDSDLIVRSIVETEVPRG